MADESSGRDADFSEQITSWARLFQGVTAAIDARKLVLAALGLIVFYQGRAGLDRLFALAAGQRTPAAARLLVWPVPPLGDDLHSAPWRVTEPVRALVQPFLDVFNLGGGGIDLASALAAAIWGALVWGIVGGAIARIAVVQVARTDRIGTGEALRFAARKWLALVGTPLTPLLGVAFFATFCALFGLLYWLPAPVGPVIAGLFTVFPLLAGLVMTILLFSLAAGWPLMHATIAAEGEDGFDALSRSFAYVHQRPARYAASLALAWALGILGLILVDLFARTTVHMAQWALSFGAPDDILAALYQGRRTAPVSPSARNVHAFWLAVGGLLAHAWIYAYFWTSATIIYLGLRQDVDGTPWHVIAAPEPKPFEFTPVPDEDTSTPTDPAEPIPPSTADAPAHS